MDSYFGKADILKAPPSGLWPQFSAARIPLPRKNSRQSTAALNRQRIEIISAEITKVKQN
jgi:hypothetical protein